MMNEQELQAFLDQLMKEGSEKYGIPKKYTEPPQEEPDEVQQALPEPERTPARAVRSEPAELPEADDLSGLFPDEPQAAEEEPESLPEPEAFPEPKTAPEQPEHPDETSPVRRHPVRDLIVGAILVMLSMVGIAALVQHGIAFGKRHFAAEPDTLPDEIRSAVLPLVLIDQPDFDDPDTLTDEQFISAAVISMLTDGRLAEYPDNLGMRVVPAADITAAGERLFGTERAPEYRTIGISGELRCYYDKEQERCLIPAAPRLFTYVPKVTDWTENGSTVTAQIDYYAEQPAWQTGSPEYIKTVSYTLERAADRWVIRAVQAESDGDS